MSARGWCPGLYTPMEAHDGLLVRVKPRGGRIGADAARCIAEAVAEYGNGRIELTSRANLQVRGLCADGVEPFARTMVACGAADADPAVERRRSIVVAPLGGQACEATAAALEAALAASDLMLPWKFGFAVDSEAMPLGDVGADVTIDRCAVALASPLRAVAANPVSAAMALARAFLDLGGRRRMSDLVGALGEAAIYAAAGLPRPAARDTNGASETAAPFVAIIPADGHLTPASLRAAADRAEAEGDGVLRMSPWRRLLIAT